LNDIIYDVDEKFLVGIHCRVVFKLGPPKFNGDYRVTVNSLKGVLLKLTLREYCK